jgi:hypothetical protein
MKRPLNPVQAEMMSVLQNRLKEGNATDFEKAIDLKMRNFFELEKNLGNSITDSEAAMRVVQNQLDHARRELDVTSGARFATADNLVDYYKSVGVIGSNKFPGKTNES